MHLMIVAVSRITYGHSDAYGILSEGAFTHKNIRDHGMRAVHVCQIWTPSMVCAVIVSAVIYDQLQSIQAM